MRCDHHGVAHLNKVGELCVTVHREPVHFILNFALLLVIHGDIVLGEAGFARPVLHKHKPDHGCVRADAQGAAAGDGC